MSLFTLKLSMEDWVICTAILVSPESLGQQRMDDALSIVRLQSPCQVIDSVILPSPHVECFRKFPVPRVLTTELLTNDTDDTLASHDDV